MTDDPRALTDGRDPVGVQDFVEHFGAFLEQSGMPPLASRAFAAILADEDGRMTAEQIGTALGASPASVSTATSYLAHVGLTRRTRERGSRRIVHSLIADDWYEAMATRTDIYTTMERLARQGAGAVGSETPAGRRLALTAEMAAFLLRQMTDSMALWEAHKATMKGTAT